MHSHASTAALASLASAFSRAGLLQQSNGVHHYGIWSTAFDSRRWWDNCRREIIAARFRSYINLSIAPARQAWISHQAIGRWGLCRILPAMTGARVKPRYCRTQSIAPRWISPRSNQWRHESSWCFAIAINLPRIEERNLQGQLAMA